MQAALLLLLLLLLLLFLVAAASYDKKSTKRKGRGARESVRGRRGEGEGRDAHYPLFGWVRLEQTVDVEHGDGADALLVLVLVAAGYWVSFFFRGLAGVLVRLLGL